jgi:hypothetical protein
VSRPQLQLRIQPSDGRTARPLEQKRRHAVDDAGQAGADHRHAGPGREQEMSAVAFSDRAGMFGEQADGENP